MKDALGPLTTDFRPKFITADQAMAHHDRCDRLDIFGGYERTLIEPGIGLGCVQKSQ